MFSSVSGPVGSLYVAPDGPAPVVSAPSITTTLLQNATVGAAYNTQLTAVGNPSTFTWLLTSGNKPSWMTISTGGLITGTPQAADATQGVTLSFSCSNGVLPNATITMTLVVDSNVGAPVLVTGPVITVWKAA